MRKAGFAIVGAAESTRIGKVPELSSMGLALDAAANALANAGLDAADVDGLTTGYMPPGTLVRVETGAKVRIGTSVIATLVRQSG